MCKWGDSLNGTKSGDADRHIEGMQPAKILWNQNTTLCVCVCV